MGRGEFERNWKNRFEDAEAEPSRDLWTGIEASIANAEVARFKRGMAFYKWVAAAGVVLMACLIGYYLTFSPDTNSKLASDQQSKVDQLEIRDETEVSSGVTPKGRQTDLSTNKGTEKQEGKKSAAEEATPDKKSISDEPTSATSGSSQSTLTTLHHNDSDRKPEELAGLSPTWGAQHSESGYTTDRSNQESLAALSGKEEIVLTTIEEPPLPESLIGVIVYPEDVKPDRPKLWAGLNMGSGYFDPNYRGQSDTQQSSAFQPGGNRSAQEEHSSGLSMSFGMEMGMRLSGRWQLSGGLQYLNNNVQSTTDLVLDNTPVLNSTVESLDLAERYSDGNVSYAYMPTDLDNSFQFLSVPVQAGYLLLDSRVKVLVNAGIASDFFLKNRISAVDQPLESVTINAGSGAPYRSVYFNGLVGAQASYEFLPRYVVTLEPRYKVALSDFTRPEVSYSSMPSSFGVGVGIKYVFK